VPDARAYLGRFQALNLAVVPMYADGRGTTVRISSDALPGYLTQKQIADATARGVKATGRGGFLYTEGPDAALIESYGDFPKERFTHIHMYHRHPVCAQQWYARHLGAQVAATHLHLGPGQDVTADGAEEAGDDCQKPYAEATYPAFGTEGRIREPSGYVLFDDIGLPIWPHPGELVSTRGQSVDHIALSVQNLGATLERLRNEGIAVLQEAHDWGGTRAAIVEGPDRVALELVEAK
jgi:catechol 2,3-dioxygenase-like lactoylglutathione lyase family enzyme